MSPRALPLLMAILFLPAFAQADAENKVNAALKTLTSGKETEKVAALKDLAAMGADGKPATRAVAAAMWNKNKDIQKQAIDTFGRLQPDMLKIALRLLLEKEVKRSDFEEISKLEDKAAIPLIRGRINKDVAAKNLVGINEGILALATGGVGDEEATDALLRLATYRLDGISRDYRDLAVSGLSFHSGLVKTPELRERIAVGLEKILVLQQQQAKVKKPPPKKDKSKDKDKEKEKEMQEAETALSIAVIKALGRYGKDARKAILTLKAYRLDNNTGIRDAALDALKAIDSE